MEVTGKIKIINETQSFGSKGFQKREMVVITTDGELEQPILIEFIKDKCDLLDRYSVGQAVKVSVNLNGREWTSPSGEVKYFNTVQGWKIEEVSGSGSPQGNQSDGGDIPEGADDLPF